MGELLFKFLIQNSVIGTISTASHLRENLTNLKTCITTVKYNIGTFNQHVKVNMEDFKSRGERTDDLMTNLFKKYHVASDTEFVRYIKTKKYRYDDR